MITPGRKSAGWLRSWKVDEEAVAVITKNDLDAAIAECQGKRNPDSSTCIKLAAFYTIRNEMFPSLPVAQPEPSYSYAPAPDQPDDSYVVIKSESEFAKLIDGRKQEEVWPVLDELMATIKMIYPRLYDAVLAKF